MQIQTNLSVQNFKAHIKINPPSKSFTDKVLGTATTLTATASIAAGVDSLTSIADKPQIFANSLLPPDTIKSSENSLFSAAEAGIPVQSTAIPLTLISSGVKGLKLGAEMTDKKIPD